jgi:anti-sigma B factor antagonist
MTITILEASDSLTFLALEGSLDLEGAQRIEAEFLALTAARQKPVIVDLTRVDFLASFGMRLLIEAYKPLAAAGRKMVLLHPQPSVEKVLLAAGMDNLVTISRDETAARELAGR